MATNPASLPSRVDGTLAVCPQCVSLNNMSLDRAQSPDVADSES